MTRKHKFQHTSTFLSDKVCLKDLCEKTNFNNVKELNSSLFSEIVRLILICPDF